MIEVALSRTEMRRQLNGLHAQLLVAQSRFDEALPLLRRAQELKPREDVARYMEQIERVARARR